MIPAIPLRERRDIARLAAAIDRLLEVSAHKAKVKATSKLEKALAADLRVAFRKQETALFKRLAGKRSAFAPDTVTEAAEPDWDALFDAAVLDTIKVFEAPLGRFIQQALMAGAREIIAQLKAEVSFDLANPRAVAYVEGRAAELVSGINDVTRAEVKRIITEGVRDGRSYNDVAKDLRSKFAEFHTPKPQLAIKDRATLIAVTEMGNGYEAGTEAVIGELSDAGLTMQVSWLTAGDDRVSEGCQENAAIGWIPFGDAFPSGDLRPLRFPGCRCTAIHRRAPSE